MSKVNIYTADSVCLKESCPLKATCARYHLYLQKSLTEEPFSVINPNILSPSEQGCEFRLITKILRMARGFKRMFDSMPSGNTYHFWHRTSYFSESTYCRAKRGAILISPEMQKELLALFEKNGADISIGFDQYEEQVGYVSNPTKGI